MTTSIEYRKYSTILEILFDFERVLNENLKDLFYNFHRDSYNENTVHPYAIKITNEHNKTKTLLFDDILQTLHYIPSYILPKMIASDFAYVSITNEVKQVPKSSALAITLSEIYATSSMQESIANTEPIDERTVNKVRETLQNFLIEYTEDEQFIHLQGNVHISKKLFPSKLPNVIIPQQPVEYEDEFTCIGYFAIYNNRNVRRRTDINLALITLCSNCGRSIVVNYEQGSECGYCTTVNVI